MSATSEGARVAALRARVIPPTGTHWRQTDPSHCYMLRDEENKGTGACARHGLFIHQSTNTDLARHRPREGASAAIVPNLDSRSPVNEGRPSSPLKEFLLGVPQACAAPPY